MRDFDETDLTILELLVADARRPYSEIGEAVDLSPPAVSDRVERLQEAGIVEGFTLDLDRSQLQAGVPLLVQADVAPGELEAVRGALADDDAVEHLFVTAERDLVFHARLPQERVGDLLDDVAGDDAVRDYDVTLLTDVEWAPTVGSSGFALECAECGNTVSGEGHASKLGGDLHHFCCPTCKARFEERYERLDETA